jgi:DNA helicase-2/ATP-dependent DNA helicase PcrA
MANFTEEQKKVIAHREGPALVLAGAGSGKSTTLIERTVALVDGRHGPRVKAQRILLTTFSKKASTDLQSKLDKALPGAAVKATTLHSLGMGVLKDHAEHLHSVGYRDGFKVRSLSPFYVFKDMFQATRRSKLPGMNWPDGDPAEAARYVGLMKRAQVLPQDALEWLADREVVGAERYAEAYANYEREKKQENVIDFDDMLLLPSLLILRHESVANRVASLFDYAMVDECQDSNPVQVGLIDRVVTRHRNIVWVGDDFQAIYGFTGATPDTVVYSYPEKYGQTAPVYQLSANFRCQANVCDLANNLIAHMRNPFNKQVVAAVPHGEPVQLFSPENPAEEAAFVVQNIKNATPTHGRKFYRNHAILYRTNRQSRSLEDALIKARMPYVIHGGESFYSRKEVRELLSLVELSYWPEASERALETVCNIPSDKFKTPTRMLGDAFKKDMQSEKGKYGSLWAAYQRSAVLKPYQRKAVTDLVYLNNRIARGATVADRVQIAVDECYKAHLRREYGIADDDGDSRLDLLEELVSTAVSYAADADKFFAYVKMVQNQEKLRKSPDFDGVNLLTIHKSKGLEWPAVHVVGLTQGTLPFIRKPKPGDEKPEQVCDVEEERRLCYVAITRAAKRLYLYSSKLDRNEQSAATSQFIEEMGLEFPTGYDNVPKGLQRAQGAPDWSDDELSLDDSDLPELAAHH